MEKGKLGLLAAALAAAGFGVALAVRRRSGALGDDAVDPTALAPTAPENVYRIRRRALYRARLRRHAEEETWPPPVVQVGKRRLRGVPSALHEKVPRGLRVQLTPNQFAKLFPGVDRLPRELWPRARCGAWGCAYPRGPGSDEVVKFTADLLEAKAAVRLARHPVAGVVRVSSVHELRRTKIPAPGKRVPRVFAVVTERLPEPTLAARLVGGCGGLPFGMWRLHKDPGMFTNFLACLERRTAHTYGTMVEKGLRGRGKMPTYSYDVFRQRIQRFTGQFLAAVERLEKQGLTWVDLHQGNLTQDVDGNPKILDIGMFQIKPLPGGANEDIWVLARPPSKT